MFEQIFTKKKRQFLLIAVGLTCFIFYGLYFLQTTKAQNPPLTIPEIFGYLNTQLPNDKFKSKAELLDFLIDQITKRRVEKPLTEDIENIFRQVGATDELILAIQNNNPTSPISTPLPITTPDVSTPISLIEIGAELRKLKSGDEQKDLIELIQKRKVSEPLNSDLETILVSRGATPQLIEIIKKNQVGAVAIVQNPTPIIESTSTPTPTVNPTPTPEQTPTPTITPTPIPTPEPTPILTPTPNLPAITLIEIGAELRKLKQGDSQKALIELIQNRKVSEPLNSDIEKMLINRGATPELIEVIKKNVTLSPAATNTPQ